jgi:hypothetical protein
MGEGEGRVRGSCVPAAGSLLIRQNDFAAASIILRFQSFDRRQEARFRLFAQGVYSSSWLRRFGGAGGSGGSGGSGVHGAQEIQIQEVKEVRGVKCLY